MMVLRVYCVGCYLHLLFKDLHLQRGVADPRIFDLDVKRLNNNTNIVNDMKRALLLLTLLPAFLEAQVITGKLVNQEGEPLSYANIMLQTKDSVYVDGAVSDELGAFKLANNGKGGFVRISSIGYSTIYREVTSTDMGTITLGLDTLLLDEVVVKGSLPKVQFKGDAMVTRIEGTVLEKAGTLAELLDKVPNVKRR